MLRLLQDTILYDINSSGFFVAACSIICTFVDLYIIVEKTSENSCLSHTIKVENVETVGSFYQNLSWYINVKLNPNQKLNYSIGSVESMNLVCDSG